MITQFQIKNKNNTLKNPHFWTITFVTLALIVVYSVWPWREWQLQHGIWRWFPWLSSLSYLAVTEINMRIIGILLLIPIVYASIALRFRAAFFLWVISLAGILPLITKLWSTSSSLITNLGFFLLPIVIALLIKIEFELRRKDRLSFIHEQQKHTSLMLEAQEKERKRIAHELHDETIQTLVAIAKRSESILNTEDNEDVLWIKNEVLRTVDDVRRITLDLRPSILDDLGLIPALRWLVDRINKESEVKTLIHINGAERKLSDHIEIAVFRIIQEALNNIRYHSKAKEAKVLLDFGPQSLRITIQDDGSGISHIENHSSLLSRGKMGLIGIRERIELLGGQYQIQSHPGEGTQLLFEIEYPTCP